jgi:ubiquinone biosynthesis protein COQ4
MLDAIPLPRFDLPRAGRALAAIMRNPDDLPQVFTLIESMSGTAPHRLLRRFKRNPTGAAILREERNIVPLLADREGLAALPEGSLGRAYLAFVESEGISAQGIVDASVTGEVASGSYRAEAFRYIHMRMRDTHDIWHAATGYKGDVVGELALLAFTLAQNWNSAVAMIILAALAKGLTGGDVRTVVDGFRRGRAAEWLPSQDWESLLPLPVDEVRRRLHLGPPAIYAERRTTELRAQGVI